MGIAAVQLATTFNEKITLFNHDTQMLARYSKFEDVEDFNKNWSMIMAVHKDKFTKLQHAILNRVIKNWAAVVPGVANASFRTYENACKSVLGHSVKRDAIRAAIDKAESLGILTKHFGKRLIKGRGSQTANVIIFHRYEEAFAYEIKQQAKEQEEIERLLQEEYERMQPHMNWGKIAKKYIEDKHIKQQEQKEIKNAVDNKAERTKTLYNRMLEVIVSKKISKAEFKEYVSIVYSLINKQVRNSSMTKIEAETLAFEAFKDVLSLPESKIKKNRAAALSAFVKNKFKKALEKVTVKNTRKEIVPSWFNKHKEERAVIDAGNAVEIDSNVFDFEEEKRKILEMLGHSKQ